MFDLTVVTPSLNSRRYLADCVQSVKSQRDHLLRHIVVDGGSTDGTIDLLRELDWAGLRLISAPGTTAPEAINIGLDHIPGSTAAVSVLNSDDYLLPGALPTVAQLLTSSCEIDVLSGRLAVVNGKGQRISTAISDRFHPDSYARGLVRVSHPSTFVRWRDPLSQARFRLDNFTCWDGEYLLQLASLGAVFSATDHTFAAFRIHEDQISSSGNETEYWKDRIRLFETTIGRSPNLIDRLLLRYGGYLRRALDFAPRAVQSDR